MKDTPCRVTLDTNKHYSDKLESTRVDDYAEKTVDYCVQIITLLESYQLDVYEDEAKELMEQVRNIKEYVKGAINERD